MSNHVPSLLTPIIALRSSVSGVRGANKCNTSHFLEPFVRLVDDSYGIDDARRRREEVGVKGDYGFMLPDLSSMQAMSPEVPGRVGRTVSRNHRHPGGLVLSADTLRARAASGLPYQHAAEAPAASSIWRPGMVQLTASGHAFCASISGTSAGATGTGAGFVGCPASSFGSLTQDR